MSMNFSHACISTEIYSSSVSADGYDVTNLISNEDDLRTKGFQAERFSKVPVYVAIEFPIPIQLKKVVIKPLIGQQCAKLLKLQSSRNVLKSKDKMERLSEIKYNLANVTLEEQTSITFLNESYRSHRQLTNLPNKTEEKNKTVIMQGKPSNVTAIKIGILQMLRGSVASICSIDVWGSPSFRCDKKSSSNVITKWMHMIKEINSNFCAHTSQLPIKNCAHSNWETHTLIKKVATDNEKATCSSIPDQFLDPIVCTLIKNPVLLPSGHTVDQRTLDKHVKSQAELGQAPSDPFTGIVFTEKQKPVPNVQLKLLLDKHALENDHETSKNDHETSRNDHETSRNDHDDKVPDNKVNRKRSLDSDNVSNKKYRKFEFQEGSTNTSDDPVTSSLENSLFTARLRSANYRMVQLNNCDKPNSIYCAKCNIFLSSAIVQYCLPCKHCLCRQCCSYMNKKSWNELCHCPHCLSSFVKNQVYRKFV